MAKGQVGERIREARAAKGWKQKHLAAEVEVEPITVSRWERGATTPDLDVLRLVADATGKPLTYFVSGGEEARPDLDTRVDRLEQSLGRLEQKLDLLLERLPQ
ncbi:MAG: helix-turn-helix protein [Gaiellaceae bacterium]|jgi:transcriptional regulator with XRE-family HTH domain|nr:helix-turn-helix protein [Gaiellaceae bacterium]